MAAIIIPILFLVSSIELLAQGQGTNEIAVCGTRLSLKMKKMDALKEMARVGCIGGRPAGTMTTEDLNHIGDALDLLKRESGKSADDTTFEGSLSFTDGILVSVSKRFKSWESGESVSVTQALFSLLQVVKENCDVVTAKTAETRRPISFRSEAVVFSCGDRELWLTVSGGRLRGEPIIGEANLPPQVTIDEITILK